MTVSLSSSGGSGGGGTGDNNNGGNGNGFNGKGNNGTGNGNGNNAPGENGDGSVNNGGRRVLAAKTDSAHNVNVNILNNNNNNVYIDEDGLYVPLSGIVKVARPPPPPVLSVRRSLFGTRPNQSRAWLERQLRAMQEANVKAWNFDFANQCPMDSSPTDRYVWERVVQPVKKEPVETVQEVAAPEERDDDSADEGSSSAAGTTGGSSSKPQVQTRVTDYMNKTKKRSSSAAAAPGKEDEASASKRGRHLVSPHSMTTM